MSASESNGHETSDWDRQIVESIAAQTLPSQRRACALWVSRELGGIDHHSREETLGNGTGVSAVYKPARELRRRQNTGETLVLLGAIIGDLSLNSTQHRVSVSLCDL